MVSMLNLSNMIPALTPFVLKVHSDSPVLPMSTFMSALLQLLFFHTL